MKTRRPADGRHGKYFIRAMFTTYGDDLNISGHEWLRRGGGGGEERRERNRLVTEIDEVVRDEKERKDTQCILTIAGLSRSI